MFEKITAEQAGLSSDAVRKAISRLEASGYVFHSLLLMRGDKLFYESYWAPFSKERPHRMYSVTKSFVSAAVGVLVGEGKVDLDAPIVTYFPEYDNENTAANLRKQTVRQMLTMTTAAQPGYWFNEHPADRVAHYFSSKANRLPGAWFDYDSEGSFVLGAMVENISKKPLLTFMKEHFLDEIGFGPDTKTLLCPGGHTWGDSSLICTARDLARFTRLVANGGEWNGKQLIDRDYMNAAISNHSDPELDDCVDHTRGYGYQIWIPREGCFSFNGMGGQFAIYIPENDFIMVCTSDNQCSNTGLYGVRLFEAMFNEINDVMSDTPLPADPAAAKRLDEFAATRTLRTAYGKTDDPMAQKIMKKTFVCESNPMGIKWFRFEKSGEDYIFRFENAQGEKQIGFGMGKNVFGKFPQENYSDVCGNVPGKNGYLYDCAASAAWNAGNKLNLFVQIIDDYLGRLSATFCFPDENSAGIVFTKHAEDFLREYGGNAVAYAK